MRIDLFDYDLPEHHIATRPAPERDGGRLCWLGATGREDRRVTDLPELLSPGSLLVVNDTRVIPARLLGTKPSGGKVEVLLVERLEGEGTSRERWRALGKLGKGVREGALLHLDGGIAASVIGAEQGGTLVVDLSVRTGTVADAVERAGRVPLPPYLRRPADESDRERYQTVYAREPGGVAAPTAGLHLTQRLLDEIRARGVEIASVTLHVSLGTFQPVKVDDLDAHAMHEEVFRVSPETADAVARARGRGAPVVAVGTTSVRALESAAREEGGGLVRATTGRTRLLIQPGYTFRVVDRLMTNFHLPRSTLLALVCAFAGRDRVLEAYEHAKTAGYRFFSYGDAMLLERTPP